jgi:hypothetical protein
VGIAMPVERGNVGGAEPDERSQPIGGDAIPRSPTAPGRCSLDRQDQDWSFDRYIPSLDCC